MQYRTVSLNVKWFFIALAVGTPQSQEQGIAAGYPGDAGIAEDPAVIFAENFEGQSLSEVIARWTSSSNDSGMSLVADVPPASSGMHSVLITSINGVNSGGRFYKRLDLGYDSLYFRYYVKYAPPPGYYHHSGGCLIACSQPSGTCGGNAGLKPAGDYGFSTAAEPNYEFDQPSTGVRLDFYTYWMGMRQGSSGSYWGNTFVHDPEVKVDYDTWACIEMFVKVNDPAASSNGEQAFWLNGRKVSHLGPGFPKGNWISGNDFLPDSSGTPFEGFQWRSDQNLKINMMKIEHYVEEGEETEGYAGSCWFDDIVLATKYIGPVFSRAGHVRDNRTTKTPSRSSHSITKKLVGGNSLKMIIAKKKKNDRMEYYTVTGNKINPFMIEKYKSAVGATP